MSGLKTIVCAFLSTDLLKVSYSVISQATAWDFFYVEVSQKVSIRFMECKKVTQKSASVAAHACGPS